MILLETANVSVRRYAAKACGKQRPAAAMAADDFLYRPIGCPAAAMAPAAMKAERHHSIQ